MFNWSEIEETARIRAEELSACLTDAEIARFQLLAELDGPRRPLRSRLAGALVRLGVRLDPDSITLNLPPHEDPRLEAQLAVYLQ